MDSAARAKNISLQYCMALPNQLMQTLELPAVTNARASDDNTPRNMHRWGIGYTALFFNELQVAPFMDNVWTMPEQPCGPSKYTSILPLLVSDSLDRLRRENRRARALLLAAEPDGGRCDIAPVFAAIIYIYLTDG